MRKYIALLLTGGLLVGAVSVAEAGKKARPVTVMTDAAGDAGNQDSGIPGVDQAGFDIVKGTLAKKGKNVLFTVEHAAMPPAGTPGDAFRLLWHFSVTTGKKTSQYRVQAKSFDIGKPDVLSDNGHERLGQVDTDGHFRLEVCKDGETAGNLTLLNCTASKYLKGSFDPAKKSVTIEVPLKSIKAKAGKSLIAGGTSGNASTSCQICWVPSVVERSLTAVTIIDSASMSKSYKLPRK